jgi:hypothetical protein
MRIWVITSSESFKITRVASGNSRANECADVCPVKGRDSVGFEDLFPHRADSRVLSGTTI